MPNIDLHMHSTASDGVFAPSEVVRIALEHGLDVIALTDHDTLAGVPEALVAAVDTRLDIISGIELGIEEGPRDIHLLGYGLDPTASAINDKLKAMREYRITRMEKIVRKLNARGIPVQAEQVRQIAGPEGVVTRPHIAQAMVDIGAVENLTEAFNKYIGNDQPCYVPRMKIGAAEGIDLIHQAGGVAVVAHPCRYQEPLKVVEEFVTAGADGVEVYYPDNPPELRQALLKMAQRLDLLVTGGCDFHRPKPDGGFIIGCEDVPAKTVKDIRQRAAHYAGH